MPASLEASAYTVIANGEFLGGGVAFEAGRGNRAVPGIWTMNLTDELQKLADMRREGSLSDQEFADAKQKLLAQGSAPGDGGNAASPGPGGDGGAKTYWSSRWSTGNTFFRDSVVLAADGILFRKRRFFGSNEEHVNYRAVASVRIKNGLLLSSISIETSGGSQPIFINGLWKSDAKSVQDAIRAHQEGT